MVENEVLTKDYVLKNGINFELLYGEDFSDRILNSPEDNGGKPFAGLTYELYKNGQLMYYCFYQEGFPHGQFVEFYDNGNIKSFQLMKFGQILGREEIWFSNGKVKSIAEYELGICLNKKEWDSNGNLIMEKSTPSEAEVAILNASRACNARLGKI